MRIVNDEEARRSIIRAIAVAVADLFKERELVSVDSCVAISIYLSSFFKAVEFANGSALEYINAFEGFIKDEKQKYLK
jgi:hypothetical protein